MIDHKVQQGECIASIAFEHGFAPSTLWDHPRNEALRALRGDPNVLLAGDVVHVPEREPKHVGAATGRVHRFRRVSVPDRLTIRFVDAEGSPRASAAYAIAIDDVRRTGSTDADGLLVEWITPNARLARITFGDAPDAETFEVHLGKLDPAAIVDGIHARLVSLGFASGDEADRSDAAIAAALRAFQRAQGLTVTGEADEATVQKLADCHRNR